MDIHTSPETLDSVAEVSSIVDSTLHDSLHEQEISGSSSQVNSPELSHEPDSGNLPEEVELKNDRFHRALHVAKRAVQSTVITTQVLPTNGLITYGIPAGIFLATKNVPATVAAAGVLTTGLEGAGALATADILSNSPDSPVVSKARNLLNARAFRSILASKEGRISPLAEGLIALYGGTPAVMLARESELEAIDRTHEQRRKYGLRTAIALGTICSAQMGLYATGVQAVVEANPEVYVPTAAVAGGALLGVKIIKDRIKAERFTEESRPRYDLTEEECFLLEQDLIEDVEKNVKKTQGFMGRFHKAQEGIYAIWLNPDNRYANILRTREAEYFPEVKELAAEVEENTLFLALVDTREESRRIVHATTLSGPSLGSNTIEKSQDSTGFYTVDELIALGNFSSKEFREYYETRGIDVDSSVSVDTNFRVGKKTGKFNGLSAADLAYLMMFTLVKERTPEGRDSAVFASINRDSILSFKRIGLQCDTLMGREDIITPESLRGEDFLPVVIPYNEDSRELFKMMGDGINQFKL